MLVANVVLKIGTSHRVPGDAVPEARGWPAHILKAHIDQRKIVETDETEATRIRQRYDEGNARSMGIHNATLIAKHEKAVAHAEHGVQKAREMLAHAEAELQREKVALESHRQKAAPGAPVREDAPPPAPSVIVPPVVTGDSSGSGDVLAGALKEIEEGTFHDLIARAKQFGLPVDRRTNLAKVREMLTEYVKKQVASAA